MSSELPRLALTLIQPWATLVMHHGKDVENRSWSPPPSRLLPGDRFWIHAGKKVDEDVELWAALNVAGFDDLWGPTPAPTGALLGHVRLVDWTTRHADVSRWFIGPIGWLIADPVVLPYPIPCRGAQGLWAVPDDVLVKAMQVLGC